LQQFNPSDPIEPEEIQHINAYLAECLNDLKEALESFQIRTLVGASGAFESFISMIKEQVVSDTEGSLTQESVNIDLKEFEVLHEILIKSTSEERGKMSGLEPMRIEMIVLASLFVKFILDFHPFDELIQTNFSLKEGAITELLTN
jgi:exopolyphosphatase/guanosine-5'-triphosphate,3'-diphosphate pyrophosphatase